jgi:hypothetical protein
MSKTTTFNRAAGTFTTLFYSGATVPRVDLWTGEQYDLAFLMAPGAADLSRLKAGAPFLKNHDAAIENAIGVIEDAWIEEGKAYATVRLSQREGVASVLADIEAGITRNVSMGAASLEERVTADKRTGRKSVLVTKWMPMEISLVAIPADQRAQILSK